MNVNRNIEMLEFPGITLQTGEEIQEDSWGD